MSKKYLVSSLMMILLLTGCNKIPLQQEPIVESTPAPIVESNNETIVESTPEPIVDKAQQKIITSITNVESFEGVLNTSITAKIPMTTEQKEEYERLGNDASYAYYNVTLDTNVNIVTNNELSHISGYTTGDTLKETNIPVNIYKDTVNDIEYIDNYTKSTGSHIWVTNKENSNTVIEDFLMLAENVHDIYETPQDGKIYYKGRVSTGFIKRLDYISLADTTYIDIKNGADVDIPITFVVKDKTNQLESIKIDLTDMVSSVDSTVTVRKTECAFTITKYGNVVLGIPEDVKNSKGEIQALVSDNMSVYKKYFETMYGENVTEDIVVRIVQDKLGHNYDILLKIEDGTENVIVDKLKTFFEHNTEEELRDYIVYYKYCSEEEQIAYCMMTLFGFDGFTENYLREQGIIQGTVQDKIIEYINRNYETGYVSDKPVEVKKEENKPIVNNEDSVNDTAATETEQNSTVGNAGHTAPTGETGQINDGSQGELQEMSPEAAANKWGIEYIGGSGLDTSGFDHGDGGYSFTFE